MLRPKLLRLFPLIGIGAEYSRGYDFHDITLFLGPLFVVFDWGFFKGVRVYLAKMGLGVGCNFCLLEIPKGPYQWWTAAKFYDGSLWKAFYSRLRGPDWELKQRLGLK